MPTTLQAHTPTLRDPGRHPRVLVVHDDDAACDVLEQNLTADRMEVAVATSADEAIDALCAVHPDVVLVSEHIGGGSGLDIVSRVREGALPDPWDADAAIIVIGSGEPYAAVRAIERGADDYVCVPFHYGELIARIRAALRRAQGVGFGERMQIESLIVDCKSQSAWNGTTRIPLCAKEFSLLVMLARDPQRTVSKQELLRANWGYSPAAQRTRTVDTHASRLRRKLGDVGLPGLVHNVWGYGYRLLPLEV